MRPDRRHTQISSLAGACVLVVSSVALSSMAHGAPGRYLLTGEVVSLQAQEIFVPLSSSWNTSISRMVEEGSQVRPGEVIVEFDGAAAYNQLEAQEETRLAELAKNDRDLARLEKELAQAEYAYQRAVVDLELKQLKAEVPEGLIGAIEYEENQLAWETAQKVLAESKVLLADKSRSLSEMQEQAQLDARQAELAESWWTEMLESFSIEASQPGFIMYDKHPWTREKFQEGDNVQTSFRIAQVADSSNLAIRVWINSVDRPHIESGVDVDITFDALPKSTIAGRLETISDAGSKRNEWGDAVYFEATVSFDMEAVPGLLPGMSALVEVP